MTAAARVGEVSTAAWTSINIVSVSRSTSAPLLFIGPQCVRMLRRPTAQIPRRTQDIPSIGEIASQVLIRSSRGRRLNILHPLGKPLQSRRVCRVVFKQGWHQGACLPKRRNWSETAPPRRFRPWCSTRIGRDLHSVSGALHPEPDEEYEKMTERIDPGGVVGHSQSPKSLIIPGKRIVTGVASFRLRHFLSRRVCGFELAEHARINESHSFDIARRSYATTRPFVVSDRGPRGDPGDRIENSSSHGHLQSRLLTSTCAQQLASMMRERSPRVWL